MITMPRRVAVGLLVVVAATVLAGGVYWAWLTTPPNLPQTVEQGLNTIGGARFERLPADRKSEYIQHTATLMRQMDDDQRRELFDRFRTEDKTRDAMRAIREDESIRRLRELANADPTERQRLLDQMKAERDQRRQEFRRRMAEREAQAGLSAEGGGDRREGERGGWRDMTPEQRRARIQQHIETGNPQNRALRHELREATGDEPGPPGRPPR